MAGPIAGSIEHYIAATAHSGSIQAVFVSLYRFLLHASSSLGVTRLAYNTGSRNTGMVAANVPRDMNHHDEALPAGENAWAVFRFNNAAMPWDILIQWTAGFVGSYGAGVGSPARMLGATGSAQYTCGISIAQRSDGVTAWNGTTLNNGNDAKGIPVWNTGSNVPTFFFPRSNADGGAHVLVKENMVPITLYSNANLNYRCQFVADYDNLVIATDTNSTNTFNVTWFGPYTPITGSANSLLPSCAYSQTGGMSPAEWPTTTSWGDIAGSATSQGSIMFLTSSRSGSLIAGIDRLGTRFFQNVNAQPNRAYGQPTWNEFPQNVGMFEDASNTGLLGQSSFVREMYNVLTYDVNGDGTRAVFGQAAAQANVKLTIPWHSGTTPGTSISRAGVQFTNP